MVNHELMSYMKGCLVAPRGGADLDLLQLRQYLFGEADHRLLVVRGREAGDQVAVADL